MLMQIWHYEVKQTFKLYHQKLIKEYSSCVSHQFLVSTKRSMDEDCLYSRTPLHMDGGLDHFFPNSIPLDLAKDGFTII